MAGKDRGFKSRIVAGSEIEEPQAFFEWTKLPFTSAHALAAFAFHIEFENAKWRKRVSRISLPNLGRLLDLDSDQLRISSFYGGLEILNDIPPLRNIGIGEDGRLLAQSDVPVPSHEELFDSLRPDARASIRRISERAITLQALEVRGRPESPLASKVPIDWGCFLAGYSKDRGRALMILDGAKLYDVELRVAPRLKPSDLPSSRDESHVVVSPRRVAILEAARDLWPGGIPPNLTKKARDRAIIERLSAQGQAVPHPKTIKRALEGS